MEAAAMSSDLSATQPSAIVTKEIVAKKGEEKEVDGIRIGNRTLIIRGRFLKTARLKDEWYQEIGDPGEIVDALSQAQAKPDIFTFWQRLPDLTPQYPYYSDTDLVAAVRTDSFEDWWRSIIKSDTRKKAKRAERRGVEIREEKLDEEYIRGVMGIFNETPVRRGKPFWHYQKDFGTVKADLQKDLERSEFIGAYYKDEMIGFVKLVYAEGRFGNPGLILSKLEYRKKYVNNALIAKSVELCARRCVPYMTYTTWRRGDQAAFLRRHGFQPIPVPRYWIPLSIKGRIALRIGLQRGIRAHVPESIIRLLLEMRAKLNATRFSSEDDF